MSLNLFDQFLSPALLGISLVTLALIFPLLLFPSTAGRLVTSRYLTLQTWFIRQLLLNLVQPLGPRGQKWALLLVSLTLFLITLNLLGLLPYAFTPTTQLSLNLGFASPLWLATILMGLRKQPTHTLGHLLPEGTPALLIPMLIIIETISLMIRPVALGVRITANLTAGHLLIQLLTSAILVLLPMSPPLAIISSPFLLLLLVLEVAVALIQAYVFVLLLSLYLQESI